MTLLPEYDFDNWSDSDDDQKLYSQLPQDPHLLQEQLVDLTRKLKLSNQALEGYREMMGKHLGSTKILGSTPEESGSKPGGPTRDDDTHYFRSYSENGQEAPRSFADGYTYHQSRDPLSDDSRHSPHLHLCVIHLFQSRDV